MPRIRPNTMAKMNAISPLRIPDFDMNNGLMIVYGDKAV
jgi:hypothetical protein